MTHERFVVDTNVIVSAIAFRGSTPNKALRYALDKGVLVFSVDTLAELKDVLWRPKFDAYISPSLRKSLYFELATSAIIVEPVPARVTCRDAQDQKFLDILNPGSVTTLITGDQDLLVLGTVEQCEILSPTDFLAAAQEH